MFYLKFGHIQETICVGPSEFGVAWYEWLIRDSFKVRVQGCLKGFFFTISDVSDGLGKFVVKFHTMKLK